MKDFYYERWKIYFEQFLNNFEKEPEIDFYKWEENWTKSQRAIPEESGVDYLQLVEKAVKIYEKEK